MKIKILMLLSSLVLVTLFAVLAHSADWNNQQGLSADQLIGGGDQGTYESNGVGPAITPQKARATEWANKTLPDFTMPSTLSDNAMSAKDSRNDAESATTTQESNTNQTTVTQTTQGTPSSTTTTSVSGSWSFELGDSTVKNGVLTLFQVGDAVFGTGSMNDGNSTLLVAASGSLDGSKLNLDLTTLGTINLYRLALTPSGDSASGDYQAFSAAGNTLTGSANGTRSSQ